MLGVQQGKRLDQYTMDYVIYDLETTGVDASYDEVIEISAIKVEGGQILEEFSSLVNPMRPIPYRASQVNHITDDMVADAPPFSKALKEFNDFIGTSILVGHNIHMFDMKFIWRDASNYFGKTIANDYIDTLVLARKCLSQLSHHRLSDLAEHYHISTDGAHRAMGDCVMNQKVFEHLGRELSQQQKQGGIRICPKCGKFLAKRNGKFGEFWGCSGFPACRHTQKA